MGKKLKITVAENLYWTYAKLAMAHAAVEAGAESYTVLHFSIRARLFAGLRVGRMRIGSLLDDEHVKMELPRCCAYCASTARLTLDHLVPQASGGEDSGDNALWVCRTCNSSKGARDFVTWWFGSREDFPPLFVLRRYLKLAFRHAEAKALLDRRLEDLSPAEFPFDLEPLRAKFPAPVELELFKAPSPS